MMKTILKSTLADQQGSALIIAVLFLALMTIIGVTMIRNTTMELQIVRNDQIIKDQVHRAEAAAMEGSQWIEEAAVATLEDLSSEVFLTQNDINLSSMQFDKNNWKISDVDPVGDEDNLVAAYRIVDETGIIDLTQTNLHTYKVYGYYFRPPGHPKRGEVLVEIGYKKRF